MTDATSLYLFLRLFAQERAERSREIKLGSQKQQGVYGATAIWHNKKYRKRRDSSQRAATTERYPLTIGEKESNKEAQETALGNAAD